MRVANILLVDDQPDNLLALEAVLQPLGQRLVRATSGDEALKLLLQDDYAVILLDVHMPGLDGFETAALIKQRERTRHVPIIFVTAISKDTEHIFRGYSEGAVDYLLKPYDPAVLRSKVSVFVQLWEKSAALEASEQRFRTAFANAPAGAALVDGDGRLALVNAAFADVVGRPEAELLEGGVDDVFGAGPLEGERQVLRPDGTERTLVISSAALPDDADPGRRIVQLEDVTERERAEHERSQRLHEEAARAEAEAIARMVRGLQAVSDAALAHLALDDLLPELLERIREILGADSVSVFLTGSDDPSLLELRCVSGVEGLPTGTAIPLARDSFAGRVAKERRSISISDVLAGGDGRSFQRELAGSGLRALMGAPLTTEGSVRGVLCAGSCAPEHFDPDDSTLLALMADRAALAIGNAHLYEREHRVVESLQRSLLPASLPRLPGVSIAARYRPGGADVGGDWYDAFTLGDGALGVAMGDVVGHGLDAAALMGELRNGLRAYAVEDGSPGAVVTRLDRLMKQGEEERMATLSYALIDLDAETIRYTSAGHPPPLMIGPDGAAAFLWDGRSTPLGVGGEAEHEEEAEAAFPAGSTLVLYTDGLVEVPGEPLDTGLARLEEAVLAAGSEPDAICAALTSGLDAVEPRDDVALLALSTVALTSDLSLTVSASPVSLRYGRRVIGRWLDQAGAAPSVSHDIQLACFEACANATEHARGDSHFYLEASHADGEVSLVVRDSGSWREPLNGDRGRGLDLMKDLMDSVTVDTGPDGTVVQLRRRLEA